MKKLQLLLVSLLFISCGIKVTKHKTPEQVNKTIQLTTNKLDNFVKANEWMVNIFTNPESIIQFTDKEAGVIKGKYIIHVSTVPSSPYSKEPPTSITHTAIITLRVKDKGAKIEIDPIGEFQTTSVMGVTFSYLPSTFIDKAKLLIGDFETSMKSENKNNW